jgi:LEA14-like dessication related protein
VNRIIHSSLVCMIFLALQSCSWLRQDLQEPDIKVVGFSRVSGGNLLEQRFALQLQVTNPNDLKLEVKGLTFTFAVDDADLVQGVSNEVPVIKPYSQTEFTVHGSANVIQAVRLLNRMQRKPDRRFNYTLNTRIELLHGWPSTFNLKREGDIGLSDWLEKQAR